MPTGQLTRARATPRVSPPSRRRATQVRHGTAERVRRPLEAYGRGLVEGALHQRRARQPRGAGRALERGPEQLSFEGVGPDVIVTDPRGIDETPHHQRDTPNRASLPAVLLQEHAERSLGDSFDQPAEASLQLGGLVERVT